MTITLRDYQDSAASDVRLAFREGRRAVLLVLATGAGKTVIFSHIAKSAAEKGNPVLILAHRDQLIKQASRKLRDYSVRHGIIMAGFTQDMSSRVQVGSVQTLVRRLEKIRFKPKLIIIDEAHLSAAKSYRDILDAYPEALVLGVTGSPYRLDGKSLGVNSGGIYDFMIKGISIGELIARGFLVRPVVYAPAEQLDLSGIKTSMGDYKTDELALVVDKPKITGSAIEHYRRICPDVPAVAWCVTVAHAQHVADEFNSAGIKAVMLCGESSSDERDKALKALETGEIKVITFVGILIEGVDCPAIGAIIMLRPTLSLSSYLQVIGRGLRPYVSPSGAKKECCYVLDHAGLTFKHGMADEDRDWQLDGEAKKKGKKKKQEEKVDLLQCVGVGGCFGIFAPAPACPHCGKPVEVKTRQLEHAEGELTEITPEMAARIRVERRQEQGSAKSLKELKAYGAKMGRSPKWAEHVFNARQRKKAKPAPRLRPPEPSLDALKAMTLPELERVAHEQSWPREWPSEFYYSQQALGGQ